jgi:hypothetical protein
VKELEGRLALHVILAFLGDQEYWARQFENGIQRHELPLLGWTDRALKFILGTGVQLTEGA